MELGRHRVFVTGGTRGIGFELAKGLLAREAEVALCGSSAERVAQVREELPSAVALELDLADIDAIPGAHALDAQDSESRDPSEIREPTAVALRRRSRMA
jgi:short-subunit dehydrogenase involved in D-alanine esterification of teichoic acids